MKKNVIFLFVIIAVLNFTGCASNDENNDTQDNESVIDVNVNDDVIKEQTVESFKFTNTSLLYENGISTLITNVQNISDTIQYIKSFNIIIKDENGDIITTLSGYIGEEINPSDTRTITSSSDIDLSDANSIEYTINQ